MLLATNSGPNPGHESKLESSSTASPDYACAGQLCQLQYAPNKNVQRIPVTSSYRCRHEMADLTCAGRAATSAHGHNPAGLVLLPLHNGAVLTYFGSNCLTKVQNVTKATYTWVPFAPPDVQSKNDGTTLLFKCVV